MKAGLLALLVSMGAANAWAHPGWGIVQDSKGNVYAQLEAKVGSNAEMALLQRFVPAYCATIEEWLAKRIRGFGRSR